MLLAIALAGGMGAVARFMVDGYMQERLDWPFPLGTFVINTTGSLLLGFLTGLALHVGFPRLPYAFLATGFCGAYTTFSTFGYETAGLIEGALGPIGAQPQVTADVPHFSGGLSGSSYLSVG